MKITEKTNIVKMPAGAGACASSASYAIYDRNNGNLIGEESDLRTAQRVAREYVEREELRALEA